MMWFESLTGFAEESPTQVRANITIDGTNLISHVNGRRFICGELETPTLAELRERVRSSGHQTGEISVREVVADVQDLHTRDANAGSLFQVASQFNLLEMVSPNVTPEHGVGIYEHDHTQGPACAVACGAGTIYRNYFVGVEGQTGQSETRQIDCLADLGAVLGNSEGRLWEMRNGYALAAQAGLNDIAKRLRAASKEERDTLRRELRIGIQWNTQVTLNDSRHVVSQAYCSALPVAYCREPASLWADFARLILESSYEATICAAILNSARTGNRQVFLTLVGGGAFGNQSDWITGGIQRALDLFRHFALDVAIVSYGTSNRSIQSLVNHRLND
jgi:hypothetical protein